MMKKLLLAISLLLLTTSAFSAEVALDDFSTYTEVDPNGHIAVNTGSVAITTTRNESAYLYKDYGADHFKSGDLFLARAASEISPTTIGCFFGLSNSIGDMYSIEQSGQPYIGLYIYGETDALRLVLRSYDGSSSSTDIAYLPTENVYYLFEVTITETSVNVSVISPTSSIDIAMLSLPLTSPPSYRYHYAAMSYNDGANTIQADTALEAKWRMGASADTSAIVPPCHRGIYYDGEEYLGVFHTSGNSYVTYTNMSRSGVHLVYGNVESVGTVSDHFDFDLSGRYYNSYGHNRLYAARNGSDSIDVLINEDFGYRVLFDYNARPYMIGYNIDQTNIDAYPSYTTDMYDHNWVAGRWLTDSTVRVYRSDIQSHNAVNWNLILTFQGVGAPQLVPMPNKDMAIFIASGSTLYFYYYTATDEFTGSLGAQQTITTDLDSVFDFRANVTHSGNLMVMWGSQAAPGTINMATYSGGTWGSTSAVATGTGMVDDQTGMTSCSDLGNDLIYLFYWSGTDIAYKTWDGTTLSGETALVTAPHLLETTITTQLWTIEKIPLMYHLANGDIMVKSLDIPTPAEVANAGVLASVTGDGQKATNTYQVAHGDYILTTWTGSDHAGHGRVYNMASRQWVTPAVKITPRYWDLHNNVRVSIDALGRVTISHGGRTALTTAYVKLKSSNYALGTQGFLDEFVEELPDWIDFSPAETADSTGRGYIRQFRVGDDFYMFHSINQLELCVRSYRNGAWDTNATFVDISGFGSSPANTLVYWNDVVYRDDNGTPTFLIPWAYRDGAVAPVTAAGSNLQVGLYAIIIQPDGSGGWIGKKLDGTPVSLPVTPSTTTVVHTYAQDGYFYSARGGAAWVGSTPCFANVRFYSTFPYAGESMIFYKWSGSTFDEVTVETTGFYTAPWPSMVYDAANSALHIIDTKEINGVREIVRYQSMDAGATWTDALQITENSSYDNLVPRLSSGAGVNPSLMWHLRVSKLHSQVHTDILLLMGPKFRFPLNDGTEVVIPFHQVASGSEGNVPTFPIGVSGEFSPNYVDLSDPNASPFVFQTPTGEKAWEME